jgi:hypothetical protein
MCLDDGPLGGLVLRPAVVQVVAVLRQLGVHAVQGLAWFARAACSGVCCLSRVVLQVVLMVERRSERLASAACVRACVRAGQPGTG